MKRGDAEAAGEIAEVFKMWMRHHESHEFDEWKGGSIPSLFSFQFSAFQHLFRRDVHGEVAAEVLDGGGEGGGLDRFGDGNDAVGAEHRVTAHRRAF
jgi:hypothetical protein